MADKMIQDIRVENIEQFIELYPQLFSQKRLKNWRQLFNSEAVLVKIDVQGSTVVSIDEAMPEQEEYAAENDRFEEEWNNRRKRWPCES